jgi:hypothetical protein
MCPEIGTDSSAGAAGAGAIETATLHRALQVLVPGLC